MKTTGIAVATFAFATALVLAIPGCRNDGGGNEDVPTTQPSTGSGSATASADVTSAGMPVNKNCPIEQAHPIDSQVTYTHDGKVYGFCCEDCIEAFKKDPAKYAEAR